MAHFKTIFLTTTLASVLLVSGCSTNSNGGTTLGVKGSPAWHKFAPASDVAAYYAHKEVYELCNIWNKKWRSSTTRNHISKALIKKGESPMYCSNPTEDAIRKSDYETRKMEKKIRDMERKQRDLEDELRQQKVHDLLYG